MEKNNRFARGCGAIAVLMTTMSNPVVADEETILKPGQWHFDGAFVSTFQDGNADAIAKADWLFSLDLELTRQFDGFGLFSWVEYSRSVKGTGVAAFSDFANADAGTAVDKNGNGRGQFSSLYVYGDTNKDGEHGWLFGLVEVTTLIDQSDYANDEVSQFLSLNMINNLTIVFPDYTIAGMMQDSQAFGDIGYRVILSSSHGILDSTNNNAIQSYSELLDVSSNGKGIFSAVELLFAGEDYQGNVGVWSNSADDAGADVGIYSGVDLPLEQGGINLRLGYADALIGEAEYFASMSYQLPLGDGTLAAAYSQTHFNQTADGTFHHGELYYRFAALDEMLYFSPAIQWFDGTGHDNDLVWGVRAEVWF